MLLGGGIGRRYHRAGVKLGKKWDVAMALIRDSCHSFLLLYVTDSFLILARNKETHFLSETGHRWS